MKLIRDRSVRYIKYDFRYFIQFCYLIKVPVILYGKMFGSHLTSWYLISYLTAIRVFGDIKMFWRLQMACSVSRRFPHPIVEYRVAPWVYVLVYLSIRTVVSTHNALKHQEKAIEAVFSFWLSVGCILVIVSKLCFPFSDACFLSELFLSHHGRTSIFSASHFSSSETNVDTLYRLFLLFLIL